MELNQPQVPDTRPQLMGQGEHAEEVYDTLVATARGGTAPLRDYVSLRKKTLGIEDFHFYDFFLPIVPDVDREYPFEEGSQRFCYRNRSSPPCGR